VQQAADLDEGAGIAAERRMVTVDGEQRLDLVDQPVDLGPGDLRGLGVDQHPSLDAVEEEEDEADRSARVSTACGQPFEISGPCTRRDRGIGGPVVQLAAAVWI